MAGIGSLQSLGTAAVTAAATQYTDWISGLNGLAGLSGYIKFCGTGGTTCDVYLQTCPNGDEATVADIYCAHFTALGAELFSLVQGAGQHLTITDGALANNTALNNGNVPLFDKFRLKIVSTGTWVSGLVSSYAMPRG